MFTVWFCSSDMGLFFARETDPIPNLGGTNTGHKVVNAATPAYDVSDMLHNQLRSLLPVDLEVDLIIVDYGVNDSSVQHFNFDVNNIKLAHEVFIRYVRNTMLQAPALLYAESFMTPGKSRKWPGYHTNLAEVHANVTQKYDIPMVRPFVTMLKREEQRPNGHNMDLLIRQKRQIWAI